jgi:uncharacterized coiled-coil DUF342 family protein
VPELKRQNAETDESPIKLRAQIAYLLAELDRANKRAAHAHGVSVDNAAMVDAWKAHALRTQTTLNDVNNRLGEVSKEREEMRTRIDVLTSGVNVDAEGSID